MIDLAVAGTAWAVANALGADPKVMLSLFEAGLVESNFQNLKTAVDHDSLGYLQQRPSQGWPNPTDVPTATKSYITRAMANSKNNPQYTAGQLAQSVQRSAYPDRYDQRESEAKSLISQVSGSTFSGTIDTWGTAADAANDASDAFKAMSKGVVNVGGLATQLAKLALPSNVMRAAAGGLGIILIFTGIILIGKQVK